MAGKSSAAEKPSRELVITRIIDAPPALVFKAWTDPKQMARWWGPKGFTNPVCELDARVGGAWRIVMRAPDGAEYPCGGVYREVVESERLAFTNIASDKDGNPVLDGFTTVLFAKQGGKTKLTLQTRGTAVVDYAAAYLNGMEAGWTQSLEKLDELMANEKVNDTASTADREIVISRVFDAPRELLWKMWTEPEHVVQWWGPRGFTTTIHEMDVRPGGVWRLTMHGPDGTDYPNKSVFIEVVKPERIVFSHGGGKKGGPSVQFQMTWTFEARGDNKTKLTIHQIYPSAAERDRVVKEFGAVEGGKQTLERLAEQIAKLKAESEFTITRVFDAPRETVWKSWTDCQRLKHWWGPKGFTVSSCKIDLRPGGIMHYCLRSPDGHDLWGKFVYREIVPPERLVFINSFSDEKGGTTHHPMSPTWPLEMLSTITFDEKDGKTAVTVRWAPYNATEEEIKTFEVGRASMQQGWTGTFDQFAEYLAKS